MKEKFYLCRHCGNLVGMINNAGVPVVCCGEKMQALLPNTTEAAGEKHLPVVTLEGNTLHINVGAVDHPMTKEHSIAWIYVETTAGGHRRVLKPGDAPEATFPLGDEKPLAVYAYCNLHGLWMTELA